MSKKRKVVSIDIELEDFEPIHLKMAEARELYEQLHELFGDKERDVEHHYHRPWYTQPYYTWYNGITTIPCNSGTTDTITITDASDCNYIGTATSNVTGMTVAYNAT